jgi:NADH dehydrogenase
MAATSGSRRVVIVGGGFAGLFAARRLGRAPVQVTLIDRAEHHLFQPLLYQCSTGILSEGKIATPLRALLEKARRTIQPIPPCETHADVNARGRGHK